MNFKWKIHRVTSACLAVALPCLALGGPPSPNTDMAVGEVDAVLTFCARTTPGSEREVEELRTVLTGKLGSGVRHSTEYQRGFDLISDALAKTDKGTLGTVCGELTAKEPKARHGHGGMRERR
jgi:hypothetical protein